MREKKRFEIPKLIHQWAMAFGQPALTRAILYILGVDVHV